MEPPARCGLVIIMKVMKAQQTILVASPDITFEDIQEIFGGPKKKRTLRCRGGMEMQFERKVNDIPALNKINFQWDGQPKIDFNETVMYPLNAGLASVSLKNDSLYATALTRDAGGLLGNPAAGTPGIPANIVSENDQRVRKLFAVILNYMPHNCRLYKLFMREFLEMGVEVYNFIRAYGPIPTPPKVLHARNQAWGLITMESLKLTNYTLGDFILYGDYILEHGRLQGKSGHDMKTRFLDGLPAFFDAEKTHMRQDNTLVYPPLYGGLAAFRGSHLNGVAHPLAGQPSIELMVAAYTPDWMEKSASTRGRGNPLTKGYVRQIEMSQETGILTLTEEPTCPLADSSLVANLAVKDITKETPCHLCGGRGHGITQWTDDGVKVICATKVIEDLKSDKTTDHSAAAEQSKRADKYKARAQKLDSAVTELKQELQQVTEQLHQVTQSRVNAASSSHHGEEDSVSEFSTDLDEIDGSDGSEYGVHQFAEQVQKGKYGKGKSKVRPYGSRRK